MEQSPQSLERAMPNFRPLVLSVLINIALPAIAIQVLTRLGVSLLYAIVASAVFPLAELLHSIWKRHSADVISVLSLVILVGSAISSLLGNDPRYALVRDSALTSITGLIFLGSLLRPRPIMYQLSRASMPGATEAIWEERWATRPLFRRTMRVLTIAWGVGLLLDSVARIIAAVMLAPTVTVIVSPLIAAVVFGGLIVLTIGYIRVILRRSSRQ